MSIFSGLQSRRLAARAGLLMLAAALAGCAASGAATYKAKPADSVAAGTPAFGYTDVKVDGTHYSIVYTANNPNQAQAFMRVRAAQVAQAAGFAYFTIEKQASAVQKLTDASFNADQIAGAPSKGTSTAQYNAYFNTDTSPTSISMYYTSAAEISLLTPAQAQGNSGAVAVASVLADAPKS